MTSALQMSGISGIDGIVPVYEPNSRWTIWSINEIYLGGIGANRYVPKVKDHVIDPDTNELKQVVSIDPSTMVPVLKKVVPIDVGAFSDNDILLGVGPGTQSDTYRVYIDKSVIPHTLAVDARLHVGGTNVLTAKIFKGANLGNDGKVISAFYDNLGTLLGQTIPLENVTMPNELNISVRTVPVCYTSENLVDGEVITIVFYHSAGHVVSKRQLLVENTSFIRSSDSSVKYITSIALESPFLSKTDNSLIQYPLNVPLRGLSLIGVVNYSDGSVLRMPVDGTKFELLGFEDYIATIPGQKLPLVLKYNLSADEVNYGTNIGSGKFISRIFRAVTIKNDGAFSVKLFGYPVWIDAVSGYRLEWYLYNLERNVVYHVTPYVKYNANTRLFDPTSFGVIQHISVSINLKDVNSSYVNYIHVQAIDVVLAASGTDHNNNWTVGFAPDQDPRFGMHNFAATTFINQNLEKIKVDCSAINVTEWLERLYYRTLPLVDMDREITPPEPNFFSMVINGVDMEFPISQWNTEHLINTVLPNSSTLFIKFFKRTADNDIQLSICALPVYQQN